MNKDPNSNVIGLGVVRSGIFKDNGIDLNEDYLVNFWVDIIKELDKKEIRWKLFTNGLKTDNDFADLLLEEINRSSEKTSLVCIPNSPYELVEIISKFKKIMACRMHASIIAYSLEIPSVGLVWNYKLRMFGETIGHSERYFATEDFNAKLIVEELLKADINAKDIEFKNKFRQTTADYLKKFLEGTNY